MADKNHYYHCRDLTGSELSQPDVAEEGYGNAQGRANSTERLIPS